MLLGSRRLRATHWALALGALCAYLACKEEEIRPDAVGDCGDDCVGGPSPVRPAGSSAPGSGGSAGAAGAAGSSSAGAAGGSMQELDLDGSIQAVNSLALAQSPVDGTVQIQAPGADGDQVMTSSEPNGDFRLLGVSSRVNLWVGVGPFSGDVSSTFMDTLQVVNSTLEVPVTLLVMRRLVFTELVSQSFLINPVELDPQRGHAILRFVNGQREGIPGVTLSSPDPATTSVAFDVGDDIYSDQATETSLRGTLVLVNLPASPYPGGATTVSVQVRGARRDVDLHVAAGAVTIVTTVVQP